MKILSANCRLLTFPIVLSFTFTGVDNEGGGEAVSFFFLFFFFFLGGGGGGRGPRAAEKVGTEGKTQREKQVT